MVCTVKKSMMQDHLRASVCINLNPGRVTQVSSPYIPISGFIMQIEVFELTLHRSVSDVRNLFTLYESVDTAHLSNWY